MEILQAFWAGFLRSLFVGLMAVAGPTGCQAHWVELKTDGNPSGLLGWVSSESFRGADGRFRAHRVGLKDFLISFRPIGWG